MSSATKYIKFRLESLTLIIHSRATLKIDDRNCNVIFFKFDFSFHKNGFKKILDIDHFVEKKILYHLRCFAPLTIEEMAKYAKN